MRIVALMFVQTGICLTENMADLTGSKPNFLLVEEQLDDVEIWLLKQFISPGGRTSDEMSSSIE